MTRPGIPHSPAGIAQDLYTGMSTADYGTPALINPGAGQPATDPDIDPRTDLPRRGSLILMNSLRELDEAKPGYLLADQMYDGTCGDMPMSQAIARFVEKSGVNSIEDLNYARVPVDAISDKLGIRAVTVSAGDEAEGEDDTEPDGDPDDQADPDDPSGGDPTPTSGAPTGQGKATKNAKDAIAEQAKEKLDEIRKNNQLEAEEQQLLLRASKYGDAYLFVWPVVQVDPNDPLRDADGDGYAPLDEADPQPTVGVDVYVNSPHTVRAFYDEEQPLRMTHVLKSWEWCDPNDRDADGPLTRATLYFPDRIERWVTRPGGKADDREVWQPYLGPDGQDQWPLPLPDGVDRIPFFHFHNDRPYGKPEHMAAYGAQRLINKLISAHGVTIDFQMFPQRYALLDESSANSIINLINPDTPEDEEDNPEGEGFSQFRADPSAIWKMYAKQVGQFEAANPTTFITPLDRYIRAISELCGIPLDRFTGYATPPSGESRRVGNEVLYEKVRNRRALYGSVLSDAYEFALSLFGFEDVTVDIKWAPLDVAAGADDWNIVNTKIGAGVPVKTALVEAGYPDDEVDGWLLDQGGADLVRRVALLNSIGTAVQALAAGVAVGMVSSEQAGDIVARVMGQIGEDLPKTAKPVQMHPQMQAMQMDLQNTMRNRQLNEHIASQTPTQGPPGEDGKPTQGPPVQMPPMPTPPPPTQVGQ